MTAKVLLAEDKRLKRMAQAYFDEMSKLPSKREARDWIGIDRIREDMQKNVYAAHILSLIKRAEKYEIYEQALKWIACLADGQDDHFMIHQCTYEKEPCKWYTESSGDRYCNLGRQSCLLFQIGHIIGKSGVLEMDKELAQIIERCGWV